MCNTFKLIILILRLNLFEIDFKKTTKQQAVPHIEILPNQQELLWDIDNT